MIWSIVIVVVLGGLGWWYWSHNGGQFPYGPFSSEQAPNATTTLPSGTSNSDDAISQDLGAIDGQMGAFASDNASVSASISDQPVEQSSL